MERKIWPEWMSSIDALMAERSLLGAGYKDVRLTVGRDGLLWVGVSIGGGASIGLSVSSLDRLKDIVDQMDIARLEMRAHPQGSPEAERD
jgi:hypothetical protein